MTALSASPTLPSNGTGFATVSARGMTSSVDYCRLVVGVAADAPATYADWGAQSVLSVLPLLGTWSFSRRADGNSLTVAGNELATYPGMAAGDQVWYGIFEGKNADPTADDVPTALSGPFTVGT